MWPVTLIKGIMQLETVICNLSFSSAKVLSDHHLCPGRYSSKLQLTDQ